MPAQTPTIFVVDDDRSVCQATQRLLSAAGFPTRAFDSAEALLDSASLDDATCLVLDINLPGLSGFQLAENLRASSRQNISFIFMTAYDEPGYAAEAQRLCALAYLSKPFVGEKLLEAVRHSIRDSDPSHQPNLRNSLPPRPGRGVCENAPERPSPTQN